MYTVLTVLIILVCILLGFVVLIQNPKGGGLSATFGGVGNQILGAKKSSDFIEKATWTLAIMLLVLSLTSALFVDNSPVVQEAPRSIMEQRLDSSPFAAPNASAPSTEAPSLPESE
ncbi:MAG: preprotein translocase subunit SecG [Chitinophagales bacterium]|nr:preprotein translocase subunit SecG [Chitinophagales bacterium]